MATIITSEFEGKHYMDTGTTAATIVLHADRSGDITATLRVVADDGTVLNTKTVVRGWSDWRVAKEAAAIAMSRGYSDLTAEFADGVPFTLLPAWTR